MRSNPVFQAFSREAQFTKELLAIGVTQLYNANYSSKGIYYQSFTCLSTGIERLMKLCLILDYYVANNAELPAETYIRKFGHKLPELFAACRKIVSEQNIPFRYRYDFQDGIHNAIINVLGNFAESSGRYANINILVGKSENSVDCLNLWFHHIDMPLYDKHVSNKKKQKIEQNAFFIGSALNPFALIMHSTEDNTELTDAIEASKRTGIWEAVAPYRQLYTLQTIRYLTELVIALGHKAMRIRPEDIPYFSEIFGLFYCSDKYFRSRKTWDKLR